MKPILIALLAVLPTVACGRTEEPTGTPAEQNSLEAKTVVLEEAEREVRCGCKIEGIGHCGNYVADGEDWLEISNPDDFGLDVMEWCSVPADEHPMAVVAGERTGDDIVLSKLQTR